tara:strand:- start:318 stop:545 length:228 start_codon:yes stop_codon:yes gene_type:complete
MKIMDSLCMFLAAFFWRFSLFAFQTEVPEPQAQSGPGIPPPPGLVVPIDSNIVILIICGILLGVYFIIDRKRRLL